MAVTDSLTIINHIAERLRLIRKDNSYLSDVKRVDCEATEVVHHHYPFLYVNEVSDQYVTQICKTLYEKILEINIEGFVQDRRVNSAEKLPILGSTLQKLKKDVQKCILTDDWFNTTDRKLKMVENVIEDRFSPPDANFSCKIFIVYFAKD